MKVIHYIGSLSFGGIERLVYDLVSQQIKRDSLDVVIGVGNPNGELKKQFEKIGAKLIDCNITSGFDVSPSKILKLNNQFRSFDLIHLHSFHLTIALAAVLSRKKIIYTEHGNFGFGRKLKLSDKLSFFLRKLFFKYNRVKICCNSNFTKNIVKQHFYSGFRIKVVHNGSSFDKTINQDLLKKLQIKYKSDFVIGVVGRLAGVKRVDRVIDVFNKFLKENESAKLLLIGEGVEKYNLLKKVNDLNIGDRVDFLGFQNEIITFQSLFDVSLIGSTNEAFGLVVIESYAARTPILAFKDSGGVVEIVNRFVPEDICEDENEMVDRLRYYEEHQLSEKVDFENQLKFFSLERMEKNYYHHYKAFLQCVE